MSKEYDKYLVEHIGAVNDAAKWMSENLSVFEEMTVSGIEAFFNNVYYHDETKRGFVEYGAYDRYFYGNGGEDEFNIAWLHHIHNNPHHWQYWLLVNDDGKFGDPGKVVPLEMPKIHALEMIADWWSFSWRNGDLCEVFKWYEQNRDGIILHERTRDFVERTLGEIQELI